MSKSIKKTPKKLRLENRYTATFVSKKIGIHISSYSRKEHGKTKWSFKDAQKLSMLYGVKIDDLRL